MNKQARTTPTAIAAAASLLCTLAASAAAQQAPPSDQQNIAEVIVTAQKREQAALDVPGSVAAVKADQLTREGKVRLEDFVSQIPGLSLSSVRQGQTQVTLRGITTGVAQSAATTAFYIDEAPIGSVNAYAAGSSVTPDLDPADLQRVEVLKGPQGTLYGAGAMGGLLRYVTAPADFRNFKGSVTAGASAVSQGGNGALARASMNIPFADHKMALRLSAFSRKDPGFIDSVAGARDVNEAKVKGGRAAFTWLIDNDWKLQAFALTQKVDTGANSVEDVDGVTLAPLHGERKQRRYVAETTFSELKVANLKLSGVLGMFDLVSSTTWQELDAGGVQDGTAGYGAALGPLFGLADLGIANPQFIHTRRLVQEVRLGAMALGGRLSYEGGAYYTHEDSSNAIPGFAPFSTTTGAAYALPAIVKASITSSYKEYSVFANATYALSQQIDLQAGVRHGRDDQVYAQDYSGMLIGPAPVVFDSGSKNRKSTYLLTARYKPSATDAVYAKVATGYRPGGPNAVPPAAAASAPQTFRPDSLTSAELGYKSVMDGGKVSFEAALFHTTWKDIQIQTSANGFNFFVNGGAATSKGAEVSLIVYPLKGLSLRAGAGYTKTALTSDALAAGGREGDALPFVPKLTSSLGASYRWPLVDSWHAALGANVAYTGERRSDFSERAAVDVPAFTTVGINAGLENATWRLSLYGKNLNNAHGIVFLKSMALTPGANPFAAGLVAPRTIGLDLTYKF
ncbi:MAG TPA: TonB-dependent receptor [Telluria sp.]|jgi:outer membrane receptor protein involved in Fe transport